MDNMPADSFEINAWYMDTKRNTSHSYIENKANDLLDSILGINPDILVVCDDNAVKYIVEPNLDQLQMPVVFCGVNWSAETYQLPHGKVTGILEILPVRNAVKQLKKDYPNIKNLFVLNENTTTSRKEKEILEAIFMEENLTVTFRLVDNFEQWKTGFLEGNKEYDLIYFSTRAAIKKWNREDAVQFIEENIKVPVFTCEDFMMPYAVFGISKIAEEHGIWAASATKKLLSGSSSDEIPLAKNIEYSMYVNLGLAHKINFEVNGTAWQNACVFGE